MSPFPSTRNNSGDRRQPWRTPELTAINLKEGRRDKTDNNRVRFKALVRFMINIFFADTLNSGLNRRPLRDSKALSKSK